MRALVITLPARHGQLSIEVSGAPKPGARRLTLSGLRREPATPPSDLARASLRRGDSVAWLRGTLVLDRVMPGEGVSGSYDFRDVDGAPLKAQFTARWSDARTNCG